MDLLKVYWIVALIVWILIALRVILFIFDEKREIKKLQERKSKNLDSMSKLIISINEDTCRNSMKILLLILLPSIAMIINCIIQII